MDMRNENSVEHRLRRLENRSRILTVALGVAVSVLAVSCATGPNTAAGVVRTTKLEIVDAKGGKRGVIEGQPQGGVLVLQDASGLPRVSVVAGADRSYVEFYDGKEKARAALSVDANGPALEFADDKGNRRLAVKFNPDGDWLAVFDEAGNLVMQAPTTKKGGG
jgi:hypothetical protein